MRTRIKSCRLEKVNLVALDQDTGLQGLTRLDLLKMDAEGFEPQVLQGARQTIAEFKPYLFIENNDERRFDTLLGQWRMTFAICGNCRFSLNEPLAWAPAACSAPQGNRRLVGAGLI